MSNFDREYYLSLAGAFICTVIGCFVAYWFGAGFWTTLVVGAVSWVAGIYVVTFVVVGEDD